MLGDGAMVFDRDDTLPKTAIEVRSVFGLIGVRGTRFFAGPSRGAFGIFCERGEVKVEAGGETRVLAPGDGVDITAAGAAPSALKRWNPARIDEAFRSVLGLRIRLSGSIPGRREDFHHAATAHVHCTEGAKFQVRKLGTQHGTDTDAGAELLVQRLQPGSGVHGAAMGQYNRPCCPFRHRRSPPRRSQDRCGCGQARRAAPLHWP